MQRGNSQQKYAPVSRTHPNTFQNIATANAHSQRSEVQYNLQHEKWDELRQKMKSMRLNKIGVTSYLNKNDKQLEAREHVSRQNNRPALINEKILLKSDSKQQSFVHVAASENKSPIAKNKLELDMDIASFTTHNKIYTTKHKQRNSNKIKSIVPYTPYFSHAYQLQRLRPSTNHSKAKVASQENPEKSAILQQKQKKVRQFGFPQSVELNLKKRKNKLQNERKKIKTSTSYYKNNKSVSQKSNTVNDNNNNSLRIQKSKQIFTTDLVQFSKLKPEDYTQRTIIRRKSNILGDCMQAIEASVLKGKIILFTVSVTSGNANYFAEIKHIPPTNIFNDNCQKCKPVSQMNTKIISHTTTGSYQMRLMMGSAEILQYLDLFALSHHPIEMQASITKLGIILVDFLTITERGLKIDKSEIMSSLKNLGTQNKDMAMQQLYRQLKNNQLVRWKNAKKSANRLHHHNLIHDHNVINHHHEPIESGRHSRGSKQGEIDYYRVYGQPHPKINSKQYDLIESSRAHEIQVDNQPNSQHIDSQPNPQKTEIPVPNISQVSNNVKQEHIDENISHRQTISVLEGLPENNSQVISQSGDVVEEVLD